nr:CHAT domain-containing protein [Saccharothrix luteola]
MSLLPLHAAGHRGRPGMLDRAVSSYTPTLRALAHTHRRPPASTRRQLVVALSSTPGLPPLPATVAEADAFADDAPDRLVLLDEDATAARVLTALTTSTWTHFACHADTDPTAPSHGGLHLHDGRLPIGRITRLRLDRAELAYLSACSTARTSLWHADEAIHLVSASTWPGTATSSAASGRWPTTSRPTPPQPSTANCHPRPNPTTSHRPCTALSEDSRTSTPTVRTSGPPSSTAARDGDVRNRSSPAPGNAVPAGAIS